MVSLIGIQKKEFNKNIFNLSKKLVRILFNNNNKNWNKKIMKKEKCLMIKV
jgi:hypothetical protein